MCRNRNRNVESAVHHLTITKPFSPFYLEEMKNYLSLVISRTVSQLIMRVYKPKDEYKLALQEKPKGASWRIIIKICRQIPCPRANHASQMQSNFPTPGCTLLSNIPGQNPRKAQWKYLQIKLCNLFYKRCCITKDTCSCYSCNYTF